MLKAKALESGRFKAVFDTLCPFMGFIHTVNGLYGWFLYGYKSLCSKSLRYIHSIHLFESVWMQVVDIPRLTKPFKSSLTKVRWVAPVWMPPNLLET